MQFAACTVPAAPVRKEAAHRSEMVSQLLFGETMQVLEKDREWLHIRSLHDGYIGWLTNHLVTEIDEATANHKTEWVVTGLLNTIHVNGKPMQVPVGSSLIGFAAAKGKAGKLEYEYAGREMMNRYAVQPDDAIVTELTSKWLNAPYLWGGRTPLGVDCSGFCQVVFKQMGIDLLRDAWQQAEQGKPVDHLADTKCGDLAFFDNAEEKIIHVGILVSPGKIIHSSGKVRIDTIDEGGIINADTGERTHHLKTIRRMY
ncbi:MAG: C40 family peptidase [Bacteroidetes bacterium]|nr:C40 family peptidase [Bacteroidota bacterium]